MIGGWYGDKSKGWRIDVPNQINSEFGYQIGNHGVVPTDVALYQLFMHISGLHMALEHPF